VPPNRTDPVEILIGQVKTADRATASDPLCADAQSRPRSCLQASPNSIRKLNPSRRTSSNTSCRVRLSPKVSFNDHVERPLSSRDDWSRRYEPYPSEQSKELGQLRNVVLLVTQRVPVKASGLVNEFGIERLPLGPDCFLLREAKLRSLCEPRASKRCQSTDRSSAKGRER